MDKVAKVLRLLDDQNHPCLGPHLRLLSFAGIWHPGPKTFKIIVKLIVYYTMLTFLVSQYIRCLFSLDANDFMLVLQYIPFHVGIIKICYFQKDHTKWERLINFISFQELEQLSKGRENIIRNYVFKVRLLTYFYWGYASFATLNIISEPYQKNQYVENGTSVFYNIFDGYTPFSKDPPGYYYSMCIQTLVGFLLTIYICGWDTIIIAIMIFFTEQLKISRYYCKRVIDVKSYETSQQNIINCHHFYTTLVKYQQEFNALISPVMCFHLFVVSINFGVCIIQIATVKDDVGTLISNLVYVMASMIQLLFFYWNGNQVTVQSEMVSDSIYKSQWVGADLKLQKQVALLALTTRKRLVFRAGPFNDISLSTYISILRGSYSFYTLLK